jgi:hypothetical protein
MIDHNSLAAGKDRGIITFLLFPGRVMVYHSVVARKRFSGVDPWHEEVFSDERVIGSSNKTTRFCSRPWKGSGRVMNASE